MALLKVRFAAFIFLLTICSLPSFSYPRAILENLPSFSGQDDLAVALTRDKKENGCFLKNMGLGGAREKCELESDVMENHAKTANGRGRRRKAAVGTLPSSRDHGAVDDMLEQNENLPTDMRRILVELDIINDTRGRDVPFGLEDDGGHERMKRAARVEKTWPGGRVPYAFDPFMTRSYKRAVLQAMEEWEQHTCVTFVPRNREDDYIFFIPSNGCYSNVGRQGGPQIISVGNRNQRYCRNHGVLLHELGHALGFWHEHTRTDRDNYLTILWDNIHPAAYSQFEKYPHETDSLGVPYDFDSIMHYSKYVFSFNGQPTMQPIDPSVFIVGQKYRLSPLDILQANLLYHCQYILNQTTVTPDLSPDTPSNTFLVKNRESHTCLAPSSTRSSPSNPIDYHSHEALYPLVLVPCNLHSPTQQWQWTANDTLLHIATFLCLGVHYEHSEPKLVLGTCKVANLGQKWNCATHHIKQPDTLDCISAIGVEGGQRSQKKRDVQLGRRTVLTSSMNGDGHLTYLRQLEGELGGVIQELQNLQEEKMRGNKGSISNSDYNQARVENIVDTRYSPIVEFCQTADTLQKWTIVDSEGDDNLSSICSRRSGQVHNLPYCYPSDMESSSGASHMVFRWASCIHSGYYVSGFYHTYNIEGYEDREKGMISAIKCCAGKYVFTGQENTPVLRGEEMCEEREWWERVEYSEHLFTKGWFTCPRGMFLKGFLLSTRRNIQNENLIRMARCCRPVDGPKMYAHCYPDKAIQVIDTEAHACRIRGYHIAGVVRKNCNYEGRHCEEILTCCI